MQIVNGHAELTPQDRSALARENLARLETFKKNPTALPQTDYKARPLATRLPIPRRRSKEQQRIRGAKRAAAHKAQTFDSARMSSVSILDDTK